MFGVVLAVLGLAVEALAGVALAGVVGASVSALESPLGVLPELLAPEPDPPEAPAAPIQEQGGCQQAT